MTALHSPFVPPNAPCDPTGLPEEVLRRVVANDSTAERDHGLSLLPAKRKLTVRVREQIVVKAGQ